MCYLQGSSIGVTMIRTSYFLYKSPNASSDAFNSSIPQKIRFLSPVFWSLPFSDSWWTSIILPELHLDLSRSHCHHCDLQAETCVFARLCKLCAQSSLNPGTSEMVMVYLARLSLSLPSAKFHCFRALDVLKFERTPLEGGKSEAGSIKQGLDASQCMYCIVLYCIVEC